MAEAEEPWGCGDVGNAAWGAGHLYPKPRTKSLGLPAPTVGLTTPGVRGQKPQEALTSAPGRGQRAEGRAGIINKLGP